MAAAVADFRPKAAAAGKLKKRDGVPEIVLEPTPDILAGLGAAKRPGQVLVGFAAETADLLANATVQAAAPSASTSSSPTTSPPPASASATTPTPLRCCGRTPIRSPSTCATSGRSPGRSSTSSSRSARPSPTA